MAVGDLAQLQAKLASAREELAALDHKREQAKAQVAAVQQDRTELTKWLDGRRAKGPQKGSVSSSQAVE
jgi:multidrug resistance efflux pump